MPTPPEFARAIVRLMELAIQYPDVPLIDLLLPTPSQPGQLPAPVDPDLELSTPERRASPILPPTIPGSATPCLLLIETDPWGLESWEIGETLCERFCFKE